MVDTNNNIGDVGIFTLESLTTGMYVDPFDALRELVQNSYDSINEAQKSRLIKEDEGLLNITVNKLLEQIIFKDNGVGIKNELIVDRLLTIGNSSKRLGENVGFRGIGRLACIAYCDEIIYKTSFKNENIQNIIKLDCEKLKEYYSPIDKKEKKLADVLQNVITRKQIDDNVESHFYEVSLIGLKGRGIDFLDESKLISYLSQVSPVDFNSHNFIYASEIQQEIKTQNCNHKNINISVNNKHKIISQIKKLYKTNYHTKKNEHIGITGINFLPNVYNDCYWGWVSKSHFLGQINNEMAGIRIRYGNILIGGTKLTDDIFLKNGDSRRFNKYYIGEIYLNNNDNLIPNSQRDNFEDTVTWRKIQNYIKEDFKLLEKDVRSFSTEYNKSIPKLRTKVEKIIDEIDDSLDSGMMTHDQKADLLEKTQKKIIELTKINKNKSDPNEQNDINKIKKKLEGRKIELQKKKKFKPPMLEAKLDRKQRFILEIITDYIRSEYGNEDVTKLRDVLLEKLTK